MPFPSVIQSFDDYFTAQQNAGKPVVPAGQSGSGSGAASGAAAGAGAAVGTFIGGPIGTLIGSQVVAAVGKAFGGLATITVEARNAIILPLASQVGKILKDNTTSEQFAYITADFNQTMRRWVKENGLSQLQPSNVEAYYYQAGWPFDDSSLDLQIENALKYAFHGSPDVTPYETERRISRVLGGAGVLGAVIRETNAKFSTTLSVKTDASGNVTAPSSSVASLLPSGSGSAILWGAVIIAVIWFVTRGMK